jgi:hypothetical protein
MTQLINFSEKMKATTEGVLCFYIHNCNNGFKQAILEHKVGGDIKATWMACNEKETEYLIANFSK